MLKLTHYQRRSFPERTIIVVMATWQAMRAARPVWFPWVAASQALLAMTKKKQWSHVKKFLQRSVR